mgnify:CR=1 FL=1
MPLYALHLKVPMNLKKFARFDAENSVQRVLGDAASASAAIKYWFVSRKVVPSSAVLQLPLLHSPSEDADNRDPCIEVELPSDTHAMELLTVSSMARFVYRIWGVGSTLDEAVQASKAIEIAEGCISAALAKPFRMNVDVTYTRPSREGKTAAVVQVMQQWPEPAGQLNLTAPETTIAMQVITASDAELPRGCDNTQFLAAGACSRVRLMLQLAEGGMLPLLQKLDLRKRPYLGPTSLDAHLGLVMCTMANIPAHPRGRAYMLDPFGGTGSILTAAAALGAYTVGMDIDVRVLSGKAGRTLETNFAEYGLGLPEQIRGDNSLLPFRATPRFDCIVTDPPYGIRAHARKSGQPDDDQREIPQEFRDCHIARTQVYRAGDVMRDLLRLAAQTLQVGGRLVYLLPTTVDFVLEEVPRHPCLELLGTCDQQLGMVLARRCVIMQKNKPYLHSEEGQYAAAIAATEATAQAMGVHCDAIEERLLAAQRRQVAMVEALKPVKGGSKPAASGSGAASDTHAAGASSGTPKSEGAAAPAPAATAASAAAAADEAAQFSKRQLRLLKKKAWKANQAGSNSPGGEPSRPKQPRKSEKGTGSGGGQKHTKFDSYLVDPKEQAALVARYRGFVQASKAANGGQFRSFCAAAGGAATPPLNIAF